MIHMYAKARRIRRILLHAPSPYRFREGGSAASVVTACTLVCIIDATACMVEETEAAGGEKVVHEMLVAVNGSAEASARWVVGGGTEADVSLHRCKRPSTS